MGTFYENEAVDAENVACSKCWSEEPLTLMFESQRALRDFCSEISSLLQSLLNEHMYNSVTSLLRFYRGYKYGHTPLPEYYHNHVAKLYPHSMCCVGNSMLAMNSLLNPRAFFVKMYPDLQHYLYYVSSNFKSLTWLEKIPEQFKLRPPMETADCQEHVMVALRFSVNGRHGFMLIDLACHWSFPVVVMADGKKPHTEPFVMNTPKGLCQHSFYLDGNYVHWVVKKLGEPPLQKNRWIFVAKKFNMLHEIEKNNLVVEFHTMVCRGTTGPEAGIFCHYGRSQGITVFFKETTKRGKTEKMANQVVPFDYLLSKDVSIKDYECAIAECAKQMRKDVKKMRMVMCHLAQIAEDEDFFHHFMKLNNYYTGMLEKSWGNITQFSE